MDVKIVREKYEKFFFVNCEKVSGQKLVKILTAFLTTRVDRSWHSHFRQNQGPVGTETIP